ncbi:MAG: hypothetical protein ABL908_13895 [Hyphomicrobium sp.]
MLLISKSTIEPCGSYSLNVKLVFDRAENDHVFRRCFDQCVVAVEPDGEPVSIHDLMGGVTLLRLTSARVGDLLAEMQRTLRAISTSHSMAACSPRFPDQHLKEVLRDVAVRIMEARHG